MLTMEIIGLLSATLGLLIYAMVKTHARVSKLSLRVQVGHTGRV
jgi:hypothetical protein